MSEQRVVWGFMKYKADPNLVYDEVSTLGESCRPQDVVEFARDPKTELHKCFDWDDETAAEKWRVHTARNILLSLKVEVISKDKKTGESVKIPFRLMQNDKEDKAYKHVSFIVRHDDEYARLLKRAKAELAAFKKRYSMIVELSEVIDEIDKILNS